MRTDGLLTVAGSLRVCLFPATRHCASQRSGDATIRLRDASVRTARAERRDWRETLLSPIDDAVTHSATGAPCRGSSEAPAAATAGGLALLLRACRVLAAAPAGRRLPEPAISLKYLSKKRT